MIAKLFVLKLNNIVIYCSHKLESKFAHSHSNCDKHINARNIALFIVYPRYIKYIRQFP